MASRQAIGFANKFYTLWSIDVQPVYTTDLYGNHWLTGYNTHYTYHKNISFDLDKVKEMYPNLPIDEELRGITASWTKDNQEDLCPQIMKWGKYAGRDIDELVEEDFQYILWICDNKAYTSNGKYALNIPKVKDHIQSIKDASNKLLADKDNAFAEVLKAGFLDFIPAKNLSIDEQYAYLHYTEGVLWIRFKFEPRTFTHNDYNGFSYGLPLVNGKAKRIKGKQVRFEFVIDTDTYEGDHQVIVTSVKML